ncbi:uncharacterized protein PV09_02065 [Verruconis gallopava]|uniref:Uncharacterized protein n=1 Tax=Verruconis gallopava TaxID=253628 RepID=A0A0D2B7G7_9PEZI|nr:uncharacterized protein PV09_02065 [Verruconis gallopava]KIW07199.1 hypothetical protein PV09_02065 [Verruconis gallopava]
MSETTTTATITARQPVLQVLADYELTHTGEEAQNSTDALSNSPSETNEIKENPDWWPEDYNAIPPYRPINYHLDRESRPWAQPGIETAFVWTMLNGVGIIAFSSKVWRQTGGRLNDKIFRFSIGGER